MARNPGHIAVTIIVGLFLGGLLAALSVAAAPPAWRGPWIPVVAGLAGLGLAALLRRPVRRRGRFPSDVTDDR
jgi:uncharacterized membrane protein YccC